MKKLFVGIAIIASMSLTACNETKPDTNDLTTYAGVVAEAKAKHAFAKKRDGNVWKQKKMKKAYVDHYLAEAEKAKKAGKDAKAMELAKEALNTAIQQVRQMDKKDKPAWIK
jgi:hypothetical protein